MTFMAGYRLWHRALFAEFTTYLLLSPALLSDPTLSHPPHYQAVSLIEEILWHLCHPDVLRKSGFF